jgi:hypothetical protein
LIQSGEGRLVAYALHALNDGECNHETHLLLDNRFHQWLKQRFRRLWQYLLGVTANQTGHNGISFQIL